MVTLKQKEKTNNTTVVSIFFRKSFLQTFVMINTKPYVVTTSCTKKNKNKRKTLLFYSLLFKNVEYFHFAHSKNGNKLCICMQYIFVVL